MYPDGKGGIALPPPRQALSPALIQPGPLPAGVLPDVAFPGSGVFQPPIALPAPSAIPYSAPAALPSGTLHREMVFHFVFPIREIWTRQPAPVAGPDGTHVDLLGPAFPASSLRDRW